MDKTTPYSANYCTIIEYEYIELAVIRNYDISVKSLKIIKNI